MGDHSNLRLDLMVKGTIEDGETLESAHEALVQRVRALLEGDIRALTVARGEDTTQRVLELIGVSNPVEADLPFSDEYDDSEDYDEDDPYDDEDDDYDEYPVSTDVVEGETETLPEDDSLEAPIDDDLIGNL